MLKHESRSYPSECGSITLHGDEESKSWDLRTQRDRLAEGAKSLTNGTKNMHPPKLLKNLLADMV